MKKNTVSISRTYTSFCTFLLLSFSSPALPQQVLSEGIHGLAEQIASSVSTEGKKKVAILPFRELDGHPTVLGTFISEELLTDLFMIGEMEIVERSMLDGLLGELKLDQTGVVDPATAKEIGKLAGADAIVTGSITELQTYVALNCRLIDAETGNIFAAAKAKIVKDDDLRKIMGIYTSSKRHSDPRAEADSESELSVFAFSKDDKRFPLRIRLIDVSNGTAGSRIKLSFTNMSKNILYYSLQSESGLSRASDRFSLVGSDGRSQEWQVSERFQKYRRSFSGGNGLCLLLPPSVEVFFILVYEKEIPTGRMVLVHPEGNKVYGICPGATIGLPEFTLTGTVSK